MPAAPTRLPKQATASRPILLSVEQRKFFVRSESLECPVGLVPYFVQLVLSEQEGIRILNDTQLQHCAVMGGIQVSSLATQLNRFCNEFKETFGFSLLKRERGQGHFFNTGIAIALDLSTAEAQQRLYPDENRHSIEGLSLLHTVQRFFEQGEYSRAAATLARIWRLPLHPAQCVEAKCWECWIDLRHSDDGEEVRARTRELARWFQDFEKAGHHVPDIVRARVHIQLARTAMAYQQEREARRAYGQARRLLPDTAWRELSSVHAGLGYIATRGGHLLEGEMNYRLALHYAALAHWPWSVQVQLGNLADVLYERYLQLNVPAGPHTLLSEANQLLEESQQICDEYGFRGSADTELYRARNAILLGQLAKAESLIEQAFAYLAQADAGYDYALAWAVRADWQLARNEMAEAITSLEHAVRIETELGTGEDAEKVRLRLEKLRKASEENQN